METLLPKESDKLDNNISRLNKNLEKLTSFPRIFFVSILQGVGGIIGATIVAGVILFVLSRFIVTIEQIPVVGPWVKTVVQFSTSFRPNATPQPSLTLTPTPTIQPTLTPTGIVTPSPTPLPSSTPTT